MTGTERTVIFGVYPKPLRISAVIEVVAVMSVHPTSENLTVLQLSGSPASAAPAKLMTKTVDMAKTVALILVLPGMIGVGPPRRSAPVVQY